MRKHVSFVSYVFVLVGVLLAAHAGNAQTPYATIVGTVKDPSGAVVPAARVSIINEATQVARESTTDQGGDYRVPLLPPGSYTVEVSAPSFRKEIVSRVVLTVDQVARVDVTLQLGPITEQVTVTATAILLDSESASVG